MELGSHVCFWTPEHMNPISKTAGTAGFFAHACACPLADLPAYFSPVSAHRLSSFSM